MGALDLQCLAERAEERAHGGEVVRHAVGQRRRGAEAGQVDSDDITLGGQDSEDRLPGLPVVPDAVEQQQRLTLAGALVGEGQRVAAHGGLDGERDLRGHACCSLVSPTVLRASAPT
jgi:hypothetical protein